MGRPSILADPRGAASLTRSILIRILIIIGISNRIFFLLLILLILIVKGRYQTFVLAMKMYGLTTKHSVFYNSSYKDAFPIIVFLMLRKYI